MQFATPENLTVDDVEKALDEAFAAVGVKVDVPDLAPPKQKPTKRRRPELQVFSDDQLIALFDSGMNCNQAAKELGVAYKSVYYRANLLGIK